MFCLSRWLALYLRQPEPSRILMHYLWFCCLDTLCQWLRTDSSLQRSLWGSWFRSSSRRTRGRGARGREARRGGAWGGGTGRGGTGRRDSNWWVRARRREWIIHNSRCRPLPWLQTSWRQVCCRVCLPWFSTWKREWRMLSPQTRRPWYLCSKLYNFWGIAHCNWEAR